MIRCPEAPKGSSKTQNGRFPCKIALCLNKVCYKVYLCENCQRQSCKAFIGLTIRAKMIGRGRPFLRANLVDTDPSACKKADFRSIFARSASAVTPSEKSSINSNRKSTTRFPLTLIWTSYVVPTPPKGAKNARCPKFEQKAAITPTRYEIGCQLLLITNRMSHMAFDWPISMTLNDLERRNNLLIALSLHSFHWILLLCWPITSEWLKV